MNQECEIAVSAPPVVASGFEALRVFVDLGCHTVAGGRATRNVDPRIQATDR